jgi:hypothetical protein
MTDLYNVWLQQQRTTNMGTDGLTDTQLRALYDRYPNLNLDQIALLAIRKQPEAFEALGVTIGGKRPTQLPRLQ